MALSHGTDAAATGQNALSSHRGNPLNTSPWGQAQPHPHPFSSSGGGDASLTDADALLDIIPAPAPWKALSPDRSSGREMGQEGYADGVSPASGGGGGGGGGCSEMLANIHMRLLDFLAWDRTRGLRCGRDGKQEAYWRALLPSVNRVVPAGAGGGTGSVANGEGVSMSMAMAMAGAGVGAGMGDEEDFGGVPETTLPGLRDSRELVQATPHGFPELLRLVAIHREGLLRRLETRRLAAARGFAGLGFGKKGSAGEGRDASVLQARVLDPLGEVMRILRHVLRSEDARPFVEPPSDADVDPDGLLGMEEEEEAGEEAGGERGDGVKAEERARREVKRPLDLGTILKRSESGWYDLEAASQVGVVVVGVLVGFVVRG